MYRSRILEEHTSFSRRRSARFEDTYGIISWSNVRVSDETALVASKTHLAMNEGNVEYIR